MTDLQKVRQMLMKQLDKIDNNEANQKEIDSVVSISNSIVKSFKGVIRNSIVVENKLLKSENKKICCKCKNIFTFKKESETRCRKCESEKFKLYRLNNLDREIERQKAYREKKKNAKQNLYQL